MSKYHFDLENDHDYTLIGMHTALEDYRLAYFLNRYLDIQLKRSPEDLDFESKNCRFSYYEYKDPRTLDTWNLISNKFLLVRNIILSDTHLFDTESEVMYLIPEKPKVDFFLKISELKDKEFVRDQLNQIMKISQLVTAYQIDPYELKSRDNLIII